MALGQPVNSIVMDKNSHVQIPSPCVHEVSSTDSETIPISHHRDHFQIRIRQFSSHSKRKSSTMQRVNTIGIHEVGQFGVATDTGEYCSRGRRQLKINESHLQGREYPEISAPRTPVHEDRCPVIGQLKSHLSTPAS